MSALVFEKDYYYYTTTANDGIGDDPVFDLLVSRPMMGGLAVELDKCTFGELVHNMHRFPGVTAVNQGITPSNAAALLVAHAPPAASLDIFKLDIDGCVREAAVEPLPANTPRTRTQPVEVRVAVGMLLVCCSSTGVPRARGAVRVAGVESCTTQRKQYRSSSTTCCPRRFRMWTCAATTSRAAPLGRKRV